ncbi:hypothetical protein [Fibrobacter sp.]|uniref:hypothetical protein n=1 Tax=Fibrobacter sp. TaxID=35828 RepID=UPI0025C3003C|nr:hypothetical protein [Fibrobacter sp.]MBR4007899.1 hypothetical protein [Fibrobacter sp.]
MQLIRVEVIDKLPESGGKLFLRQINETQTVHVVKNVEAVVKLLPSLAPLAAGVTL